MPYKADDSPWSGTVSDLLNQASAVLNQASNETPVAIGQGPVAGALPIPQVTETLMNIASRVCPVTGAAVPLAPPDKSRIRQQAHELVEALLGAFNQNQTAPQGATGHHTDQVPLLQCVAPVEAGDNASATLKVANEEGVAVDVGIYCTNFLAESGHEVPAMRVTTSPRRTTVPARGEAKFEVSIAVPPQTPAGIYSGLLQATGCRYVKAVLCVEVR
jgi:hypothetical protein